MLSQQEGKTQESSFLYNITSKFSRRRGLHFRTDRRGRKRCSVQTTSQSFPIILLNLQPPDSVSICRGDTATLQVSGLAGQNLSFNWSPVQSIVSGASTSEVRAAPLDATVYTVVVEKSLGCRQTFQVSVNVSESLPLLIATADPDTIAPGETTQLEATFNPDYRYEWTPDPSLSQTDIYNPTATPVQSTTYRVRGF